MGQTLMDGFQGRKAYMKLTWDDVAKRVHKDVSTVKKQLSMNTTASIAILDEYAAALDAEIVLLSGDALADFKASGVPRAQKNMADLDREVEVLKEKLDEKDEDIKEYKETIKILRERYDNLVDAITLKDRRIEFLTDKLLGN